MERYHLGKPTEEEKANAIKALKERQRKQQKAFETRQKRADPIVKEYVDDVFEQLELQDPKGNIRSSIARYSIDAISKGVCIFLAKRENKTLPETADGRYLMGIIRNKLEQAEGERITELMIQERLYLQEKILSNEKEKLKAISQKDIDVYETLKQMLNEVIHSERNLCQQFWIVTSVDLIKRQNSENQKKLIQFASRRIYATYSIPYKKRLEIVQNLTGKILSLE